MLVLTLVWFHSFQLALSPSPRTPSEAIPVQNSQQLTLKVEGVVQHGSTPGLFRRIQSVCLNVTSVLQSKTGPDYKVFCMNSPKTLCLAFLYSFVVCFGIDIIPIFPLFRLHSTLRPMRSSSVWNPTTTTSAPSSCWISLSWALTQSRWRPLWWMRTALSGRQDQRPQYLWNHLRILTHSSSAISCSKAELSLLHRGVHTLDSELLFCCTQFYIFSVIV